MSWAEVKKINSDLSTPINIANYINHIDLAGSSYIGRMDIGLTMELCKADMLYLHPVASGIVGMDALSTEEKFETLGFVWMCKAAGVKPGDYRDVEDFMSDNESLAKIGANGHYAKVARTSDIFYSYLKPFSEVSWDEASLYRVEDERNIIVAGETITLQIYGFDHDDLTGGGKANTTLGMKHLMAATRQMNGSNTNAGGWAGCAERTWLNGTLYGNLPIDLRNAIKPVDKRSSAGSQSATIVTTSDNVFHFAEEEIFSVVTYAKPGEGRLYPIFQNTALRIKKLSNGSGAASHWWERSPHGSNSTHFCTVYSSGGANNANISYGVCWGVCV